jgi:hypothetical protein
VAASQNWPYEIEILYSAGPDGLAKNNDDLVYEFSRYPSPASKDDPSKPRMDMQQLKNSVGWDVKPPEWP